VSKAVKFFRKQADKAEQAAVRTSDPERSAELRAMASAFRTQADVIKKSRQGKKRRSGADSDR